MDLEHFQAPSCTESDSQREKIDKIASHFQAIMEILGLDLSDPSLQETPSRVAKMYVNEIFSGLDPENFPTISMFPHTSSEKNMIVTKTGFISFCEHHFVPMIGTAYIGYIPNDQIIGLSKFARIVDYFARRPQLQERLTHQIISCCRKLFQHDNIGIIVKAKHLCVVARGVQDEEALTSTIELQGVFQTPVVQQQFFELIRHQDDKLEKEV